MINAQNIIEQLREVCGLEAEIAETPVFTDGGGIFVDKGSDSTVFVASHSGKNFAFSIKGCGEKERVTAALAREFVLGAMNKANAIDEREREFLNGVGDVPPGVQLGKCDYYVFAVYSVESDKSVREYLKTMAGASDFVVDMFDGITAFCKKADNDNDYQSAGEFASVLKENLAEEIKGSIKIGVGGIARGASELPRYFAYAKSALIGGAEIDMQNDIYSYKEYALVKLLSELPTTVMERYVKTVLDRNYKEVLADEELMLAAEAFFKYSLNISEASRSMYVHRNTLIYRLDKIEKLTGLNLRNFYDAMTFRAACLINKMCD